MRSPLLILSVVAALGASVPAASAAPSASVRLAACDSALDAAGRTMTVEGRMRTLPGARKLQMRFELQTRRPDRALWTRVVAPGFGVYATADPAPRRYVFDKRVERLTAPAQYRMLVRFRWLGAGDERLASVLRTSAICRQADLRPDLEVDRVAVSGGTYTVPVRNTGRSGAGPFAVGLSVDGVALAPVRVITGLQVDGRSEVVFDGPPCRPGRSLVARVDPDGAVDERDEADNELVRACP